MTDPDHGWIDPNPPNPVDRRSPVVLAVSGVLLTALVVATLIGVVVFAADDEGGAGAQQVELISANVATTDAFSRSIVVAPVSISDQGAFTTADLLAQLPVRADRGVRVVSGLLPGLYGATGPTYPCDAITLANDLDADRATAGAWGLALGITPQQIPYYLNTLTAVVLMADTWVTTHAWSNGAAEPRQAVLQAGNAVLIDPLGVPRVHCATGAPLVPPANDTLTRYRTDGEKWSDFAAQNVVAVDYAAPDAVGSTTEFTLLDINTGQRVVRRAGDVIDLGETSVPLPDPAVMNVPPADPESGDR